MIETSKSDTAMETIIYRGNQIRKLDDGTYLAYIMDRYGDIEECAAFTLEDAQSVIDKHIKGRKSDNYE